MLNFFKKTVCSSALLFIFIALFSLALSPIKVSAQEDKSYEKMYFTPQVEIPNSAISGQVPVGEIGADGYVNSTLLAKYIKGIYNYGLGIGGVLATVMLMVGGLIWLTSGGESGKVGQAKKIITGSIVGMILLYGAFLLLNTINPELVEMKGVKVIGIKNQINDDAADGIINDLSNAPADTKFGWVCMSSDSKTCADTNPPTMNLSVDICYKEKGADSKPTKNETDCRYIWCCGQSIIDQTQRNDFCKGESNGKACRLTSTGNIGEGFCKDNICTPCRKVGETCGWKNYECAGASGFCGSSNDGTNYCKCPGGSNCKCVDKRF